MSILNSWGVKRPDNYKNNDDWDRLIYFINLQRPDNFIKYKGESDQFYGINRHGIGHSSPYEEDFEEIVNLSVATKYIFELTKYIGALGSDIDEFEVKLTTYEIGDINKL